MEWIIARWVTFAATIVAAGACTLGLVIVPRAAADAATRSAIAGSAARIGLTACLALVPASGLRLLDQVLALRAPGDPWTTGIAPLIGSTMWGTGFLLGCGATLMLAVAFLFARRLPHASWPWWLALIGSVALCASPSLQGHAIGSEQFTALAVAADIMHVSGAALWLGTLSVVAWMGVSMANADVDVNGSDHVSADSRLRLLIPLVPRVALPGAAMLLSTGVASSVLRLTAFSDLWSSEWGRYVLAKAVLASAIVALGAINWRVRGPQVQTAGGAKALRQTMLTELAIAALVLVITAVLVVATPPGEP